MNRLFLCALALLISVSLTQAQDTATKPTTKPAATKPARPPRQAADAVSEVQKDRPRHEKYLAAVKANPDTQLVFLGDSITDAFPNKGKPTWAKFADYKPVGLGISGDRTEHVLWRISHGTLDGIKPKVLVLMIGTNNIGQLNDEKPEWAAAGVEKIVREVQAKLPETKILLLAVFPRQKLGSPQRTKVNAINQIIAKLDDGSKVKYLDISKAFLDENGEIPKDVMGDALHPTEKGYELWYEAMWPTLEGMLK